MPVFSFFRKHENKFPVFSKTKKPPFSGFFVCGETGIRTQGTLLRYTHFPGVLLRPLGHLSEEGVGVGVGVGVKMRLRKYKL